MIHSIDQLGREVTLNNYPKRIISLVPSISELIWDFGLKEELCGITKFCIHPNQMFQSKIRIGGTKNIDHEKIFSLNPDLIIGNKEENTKEDIEKLTSLFPIWMSDVNTFSDALSMISNLGKITGKISSAEKLIHSIEIQRKPISNKPKVIYLIWNDPIYAVGKNTFIDTMLLEAGFENCISTIRYPEVSIEEIKRIDPDYLFLSTEPFPFEDKHIQIFDKVISKEKIKLVNGEYFSWYGSRLKKAYAYFENLRIELNHRS